MIELQASIGWVVVILAIAVYMVVGMALLQSKTFKPAGYIAFICGVVLAIYAAVSALALIASYGHSLGVNWL